MSQPGHGGPTDDAPLEQPGASRPAEGTGSGCANVRNSSTAGLDITRLVEQFAGILFRYAYRLTGTVHDAEDLVQQTFALAQEKLHTVSEPEKIQAWLLTCLRRRFYRLQQRRPMVVASSLELDVGTIPASGEGVEERAALDEESGRLQQALGQLPVHHRLVLMMFYFEERSYHEIATELEIPVGTVMSRLSRAKSHLRQLLTPDANLMAVTRPVDRTR